VKPARATGDVVDSEAPDSSSGCIRTRAMSRLLHRRVLRMDSPILAPAAVLVLWSMVVLVWVSIARFGAIRRLDRSQLRTISRAGTRGQDLESNLPDHANWKSHNYTHLMEQPTVFYAAVVILALSDAGAGVNLILAWAYVVIRVVHSIWQSTVNRLPIRMALFGVSSLCLIALAVNAVIATVT
jgi:hypothetical protein